MADGIFRQANAADIPAVWGIITDAKALMAAQGSTQWNDSYPLPATIEADVARGEAYVIETGGRLAAYGVVALGGEGAYDTLSGAWLVETCHYATIHRLAVAAECRGHGYASTFIDHALRLAVGRGCPSMRADTAECNAVMSALLLRKGFVRCGKVCYPGVARGERIAYEKLL